jgi:hypothetical protein
LEKPGYIPRKEDALINVLFVTALGVSLAAVAAIALA